MFGSSTTSQSRVAYFGTLRNLGGGSQYATAAGWITLKMSTGGSTGVEASGATGSSGDPANGHVSRPIGSAVTRRAQQWKKDNSSPPPEPPLYNGQRLYYRQHGSWGKWVKLRGT